MVAAGSTVAAPSLPAEPRLGRAVRDAAVDFYYNSWRFVPGNVVWALVLAVVLLAAAALPLGFALVPVLAVPVAGLHRMAALVARAEPISTSDFVDGMRRFAGPSLAMGAGAAILAVVFTTNVVVGIETGGPIGYGLAALALYGDVALAMLLVAFWPVLVDPARERLPVRRRLVLAGLAVIGRPGRMLAVTAVVGAVLAVSTVLLAAIVLVGVAYASLVGTRYVLPLVDHLEARLPA